MICSFLIILLITIANLQLKNVDEALTFSYPPDGFRITGAGSLDAAVGVVISVADPNPEPDVPGIQCVIQIAVEYYLEIDEKKANYFQKKLNGLVVKSLDAPSVEKVEKMENKK